MRVKLTVAYDGTEYCGWQVQPNGDTVQEEINKALNDLFKGQDIRVCGASRTDAGVHAMGNVAAFDVDTRMPAEKIAYALNERLPRDIVIQQSEEVTEDFHPRFAKTSKTYEYRILNTRFDNPLLSRYTYFYHYPLDVEKMQQAAEYLKGRHDFTSFASVKSQTDSFIRTIYDIQVYRGIPDVFNDIITIQITGDGFLYNMVRIIAGTLIQVGAGMRNAVSVKEALEALDRSQAGPTAPPEGLTLIEIKYQ